MWLSCPGSDFKCVLLCFAPATIQIIAQSLGSILNSVSSAGKVFEYLDRKPQVSTDGTLKPDVLKGHVAFQHVNFAYPSCPEQKVLRVRLKPRADGRSHVPPYRSANGSPHCRTFLWS